MENQNVRSGKIEDFFVTPVRVRNNDDKDDDDDSDSDYDPTNSSDTEE
jgi:hypothetical protein